MITSPNHWWQNWPKTHAYVAEKMFFPKSAGEIAQAIRAAETDLRPLRAVGGGWSFSDASLPGTINTNRPNVYAVEALSAVVPHAVSFPKDRSKASVASIVDNPPLIDAPGSMVMFSDQLQPPRIDSRWTYMGAGHWEDESKALHGGTGDPWFLKWLATQHWRPIREPMGKCVAEADTAGSLMMFDLAKDPTKPSRDWFYNGNGIWSVGVAGDSVPDQGNIEYLSQNNRLAAAILSPKAADEGDTLSLLLATQKNVPARPEPVYLINTRSLVSSLQQDLPSILSASAKDVTSAQPASGKPQRFLFHVEGGITIAELGRLLAHQSPRLSLQAISGSPGATLAGALATGTHGAEFNWPLVVDRVKAVHLVGPGGLQWWIEGNESIADPQKVHAAYPDIPLERIISGSTAPGGIVSQDWLTAAVVSMGSLGVVYSIVLEVVPLFGVHEIVVQTTWRNLPSPGTSGGQPDWRWCNKCYGLFFAGGQSAAGNCVVGDQHEKGVSGNYTLAHDAAGAPGQSDWRWCHKCQGLFFSGGQSSAGICIVGGQHETGVSGNYTLVHDSPGAIGQPDWRWCHKCQGLFFSAGQSSVGNCPAGQQHEKGVSGNYTLAHDVGPLLRSPATSREVSSYIVTLLQSGELNNTGIPKLDAQGNPINQYADLAINPNRKVDGDYDCWIGNREVTAQVPLDPAPAVGNETAEMIKGIGTALGSGDLSGKLLNIYGFGSFWSILAAFITPAGTRAKLDRLTGSADIIDVALDTLLTPMIGKPDGGLLAQAFLTGALSGLLGTANCDRRSDKTGVSVGALGFPDSGVMGTALEIALSPADAFGFLQTEILDYADLNMAKEIPFFGYVSIRLCSMTESLMGMQQFGDAANPCSVMIEVVGYGTLESRKFMQDLQQRTLDRIEAGTLDAMLHWGLENDLLRARHLRKTKALQKRSQSGTSKLSTFKAARAWLHTAAPAAYRVFDNSFTERLGLSALDGLVFCDEQRKVINVWNPIAQGTQGFALRENTPRQLFDLSVLNQFAHDVQVLAVRIRSSKDVAGTPVFKVVSQPPFSINAGQSYPMAVAYNGAKAGPLTGIVEVECDDPIDPIVRIPLSATVEAIKEPELQITPPSVDLDRLVGATVWQDLTITNIGDGDATFAKIEVSPSGPFTVQPDYPALSFPGGLAHGSSVVIRVLYQPIVRSVAHATLGIDVTSLDPQYKRRYEIPLTGTAGMPTVFLAREAQRWLLGPGGTRSPVRDLESKELDFGFADLSQTSAASFWIRNVGDAPLTVQEVSSLNSAQDSFQADNSIFPITLPPGGEKEVPCLFSGGLLPGKSHRSELRVLSDDPSRASAALSVKGKTKGPSLIRLAASGLPDPGELLDLGIVPPSSGSILITFRSDGTEPVKLRDIKLTSATDFTLSGVPRRMPAQLAPGAELTLRLTLTATLQGRYETWLLVDHATANPISVQLLARVG